MISKREDNIPGTHTVQYNSKIDSLEIKHTAHNRKGFALGAVIAAEWILNKKGVFNLIFLVKLKEMSVSDGKIFEKRGRSNTSSKVSASLIASI